MSLGATASAPASAWLTAVRASRSSAETNVGHEDELRYAFADCAKSLLHDPLVVPGTRSLLVLLLRDPEQEQCLDSQARTLLCLGDELLDREPG